MAGPLLRIVIRLKANRYHRIQIAARYRLIDLFKQIARDLHLTVDQLLHVSVYRHGPTGCALVYPFNEAYPEVHDDVSLTLDTYGLASNEELYIDLTTLFIHQEKHDDDNDEEEDESEQNASTTMTEPNSAPATPSAMGQLSRYAVPADNSCLFSSIYFVLHSGKLDLSSNKNLRNLVATKIESDELTYSEAILGRTNADYCQWIRRGRRSPVGAMPMNRSIRFSSR